jgi:cytoskeletal protein RodZ
MRTKLRHIGFTILAVLAVQILAIWFLSYVSVIHLSVTNGSGLIFEFHCDDGMFNIGNETSRLRTMPLAVLLLILLIWPLAEGALVLKRHIKQKRKIKTGGPVKSREASADASTETSPPPPSASPRATTSAASTPSSATPASAAPAVSAPSASKPARADSHASSPRPTQAAQTPSSPKPGSAGGPSKPGQSS